MGDMLKIQGSNKLLKKYFKIRKFTRFSKGIKKTFKTRFL